MKTLQTFVAVFSRWILIGLVLVIASLVAIVAVADTRDESILEPANWAAGSYASTVVSIGLKLQTLGVEPQASYTLAKKCVGEPESVVQEAQRYMTKDSDLMALSTAMVFIMHDRCGLLAEKKS